MVGLSRRKVHVMALGEQSIDIAKIGISDDL